MAGASGGYAILKNIANRLPITKKMKFLYGLTGLFGGGKLGGDYQLKMSKAGGELEHLSEKEIEELKDPLTGYGTKMGATEVVGAAAMRALGGTFTKIKNMVKGIDMSRIMRDRALEIPENLPAVIGEVNAMLKKAGIDKEFAPDSARILNDPEFMSAVVALERDGGLEGSKIVKKLYGDNQQALNDFLEVVTNAEKKSDTLANAGTSRTPELDVGTDIKTALKGELGSQKQKLDIDTQAAELGELARREIIGDAGGTPGSTIGDVLRTDVKTTYDELRDAMKKEFKDLANETDATQPKFMPANTLEVTKSLAAKLGKGPAKGTVLMKINLCNKSMKMSKALQVKEWLPRYLTRK